MADSHIYFDGSVAGPGTGTEIDPYSSLTSLASHAGAVADGDTVYVHCAGLLDISSAVYDMRTHGWSGPGWIEFTGDQVSGAELSALLASIRVRAVDSPFFLESAGGLKIRFNGVGLIWTRNGNGTLMQYSSASAGMATEIANAPIRSEYPALSSGSAVAVLGCSAVSSDAWNVDVVKSSFGDGFARLYSGNYMSGANVNIDKISAADFSIALGVFNTSASVSVTNSAFLNCPLFTNVDTFTNNSTTTAQRPGIATDNIDIDDFSGEFTSLTAGSEDFTLQNDSALLYAGSDGNHIGADQAAEVAPSFTMQPSAGNVVEGDAGSTHTFTVVAVGPPAVASYQWQKDDQGDNNFVNVSGATSNTLEIAGDDVTVSANNGDQYRCVATNSIGSTNSNAVALTVTSASYLITPPAQIRRGEAFDVTITTSGTAPDTGDPATIDGEPLTVNSVTGTGPEYTMNLTVPSGANVQYNDTGWPIAFTIDSVTRNSAVVPFLPPTGNSYVDLVDPETVEGTVFYGGDVTPQTGGQVEWYIVSGTGTVNVLPNGEWVWDAMPGETVVAAFRYIAPDGTLEAFANHTFGAAGDNVPANPGNQALTNQEPATRVYFTPFEITGADPGEPIPSSLIAGSQAEWQVSTDGGSTYDTSSSAPRTLYNGNFVRASLVTGPDFANVGPNYTAAASINMNGVIVQLSATNRDAVVPVVTSHVSNQSVTAGAAATFGVVATGANGTPPHQWVENIGGEETEIASANAATYVVNNAQLADSGRGFAVYSESSEGGRVRSPATGYATLTVIANATRLVLPELKDPKTGLIRGNQQVPVRVSRIDSATQRTQLLATVITTSASGSTNLDSNLLGAVGTPLEVEYLGTDGTWVGQTLSVVAVS